LYAEAESPTIAEGLVPEADFTVAEAARSFNAPGQAVTVVMSALGKLTWDNGEVHQLVGPVLIGRDVVGDEAVVSGELAPMVPSGQNDSMSRVHAELRAREGELVVVDRGSTNGTFIWDEPAKAWQRLAAGEPHVVRTGTVLAFGERTATFEAS
jgi:RND superfamily putative drug exporter